MKDLTEGSIASHLVRMAMPIGIGILFQTLYYHRLERFVGFRPAHRHVF
jgi:hypothetical protein